MTDNEPAARGRPRSAETDTAILSAAIALIRDIGYDAVSIEGIAERAGVGKTTIYRRWPSKEPLVVDAIGRIMSQVTVPDTGSVRKDLRLLLRSASRMYEDPATRHLLSGLIAAMARSAAIGQAVRAGFVGTWREALRVVLHRAVRRGEIRAIDLDLANDLLSGPLLHHYFILGAPVDERLTRRVIEVILRGLQP